MSEPLRTYTERTRDQRRIEALEAELATGAKLVGDLADAYQGALEALAEAQDWRGMAALMALAGGFLAIFAIRAFSL